MADIDQLNLKLWIAHWPSLGDAIAVGHFQISANPSQMATIIIQHHERNNKQMTALHKNSVSFVGNIINIHRKKGIQIMFFRDLWMYIYFILGLLRMSPHCCILQIFMWVTFEKFLHRLWRSSCSSCHKMKPFWSELLFWGLHPLIRNAAKSWKKSGNPVSAPFRQN